MSAADEANAVTVGESAPTTRDSAPTPASPAFVPPDPDNRTYPCSQRLGTFWCVLPEGHTGAHLGPPDRELEHTDFGPGYVSRRGRR